MTREEVHLLQYRFLPEKMREAGIIGNRDICHLVMVLYILFVTRDRPMYATRNDPWTQRTKDAKSLNALTGIGEAECQEILDELVNVKFIQEWGPCYLLADEIEAAWEEARWGL